MLRAFPGCALSMFLLGIGMGLTESNNEYGGWLTVLAVFLYLSFFSIGLGPTPWTVNSEIYPLHLRGIANSMATLGNWTGNYVISAVFLSATETNLGKVLHFIIYFLFFFYRFLLILLSVDFVSALIYLSIFFCQKQKEKPLKKTSKIFFQI